MKNKQNVFYKTNSKGISLIVLVITIIVIIILATAILVSVINNNPISEANKARYESDRDNMQAVFTNTVGKIMSKELGTVNVTAGQINTETTGVSETAGEVVYTVNNAMISANASGKIVFDKGTNDATTYYTGKKLPIYAAGETKWYVDSEGILSLKVAGIKYGNGEIVLTYKSLGNYEHETSDGIIESHDTENGTCSKCGETVLLSGTYDENGNLLKTWEELGLNIEEDTIPPNSVVLQDEAVKLVIPEGITKIGNYQFSCMINGSNKLKEILLPETITSIGRWAFQYCTQLTTINFPNSVTIIGFGAFEKTSLTEIIIPNNLTNIEGGVFRGCGKLTSIIVSSGNSVYDSRENCNAIINSDTNILILGCQNTKIPDGIVSIGEYAFYTCTGLTSIEIPDSVTSIGSSAFSGCTGLTSIEIPNNVTSISSNVFDKCTGLSNITLPDSITSIDKFAFNNCTSLTEIIIPNSVTSIGEAAFQSCALSIVRIPEGIKKISPYVFGSCRSLTEITIPDNVTEIEECAFSNCTGLKSIYIPNSVAIMNISNSSDIIFKNCLSTLKIFCGASEKQSGWGTYWNYYGSGYLSVTYGITRDVYETTYKQ